MRRPPPDDTDTEKSGSDAVNDDQQPSGDRETVASGLEPASEAEQSADDTEQELDSEARPPKKIKLTTSLQSTTVNE